MSTWFITGCSTGLGRALAEAVLARGDNAVVTARDAASVQDLADAVPGQSSRAGPRRHRPDPGRRSGATRPATGSAGSTCWSTTPATATAAAVEEGDDADVAAAVRHQLLRRRRH